MTTGSSEACGPNRAPPTVEGHRSRSLDAITGPVPTATSRTGAGAVLPEHDVRPRGPLDQAVLDHRAGAGDDLFSRLEDGDDRAAPVPRGRDQALARAEQPRDVDVVAAGVHGGDLAALVVGADVLAGVGQAGPLLHGQAVHVGAEPDHGPPFEHDTDDAGAADARRHLVATLGRSHPAATPAVLRSANDSSGLACRSR